MDFFINKKRLPPKHIQKYQEYLLSLTLKEHPAILFILLQRYFLLQLFILFVVTDDWKSIVLQANSIFGKH